MLITVGCSGGDRVEKRIILERESWWKETLGSREFGLNAN